VIDSGRNLFLSEADINELAQAKGANVAGFQLVVESFGLGLGDLTRVDLAGGFARHLDLGAARRIGLLPDLSEGRLRQVGNAALEGAARGATDAGRPMPLVIAVTVLSSQSGEDLASPASLAFEAKAAGLDGVVVSGADVRDVRDACGDGFCLVVPGIRPFGSNGDDQVRVLTPGEAIERGADYLVVGRPITGSPDPGGVARGILLDVG